MGLKELVKRILQIEDDEGSDEYQEEDFVFIRQEGRHNLQLARLFLNFNPSKGYYFTQKPKSRLYSKEEIAQSLYNNRFVSNLEQGIQKAKKLIKKSYISFYFAARGASGVNIKELKNLQGNTKYRFSLFFGDEGDDGF